MSVSNLLNCLAGLGLIPAIVLIPLLLVVNRACQTGKTLSERGISHRYYQLFTVGLLSLLYISIVLEFNDRYGFEPVVLGSLLGAFPLIIFETNKRLSKPHVTIGDVRVVKYPHKWYLFDPTKKEKTAPGAIGIHAVVTNDGRETARDCEVKLTCDKFPSQSYRTRWRDGNLVQRDIAPGESQEVDLAWINLKTEVFETAEYNRSSKEDEYPPGDYEMIPHREITGESSFTVAIRAANMPQETQDLLVDGRESFSIPDDFIEIAEDWGVIAEIKERNQDYVVHIEKDQELDILEVPETMNLRDLTETEAFDREEVVGESGLRYPDALKKEYNINRPRQ